VKPTIALCHPWLGLGGSEAAVMWGIVALREHYDITLVTASEVDLGKLNAAYGTDVVAGDFHLLNAPSLPTVKDPARLAHWRVKRFEQFCRSNTERFDIPLSAYNPIDFGRPGIHLVGDFSWDEDTRAALFGNPSRRQSLRKSYLWLGSRLFGTSRRDIFGGRDLVAANSNWTAEILGERFGLKETPIVYPPVNIETPSALPKSGRADFVCVGRISYEKRIEVIIDILSSVRARGNDDVRLTIVGAIGDDTYGSEIADLVAANRDWIEPAGFVIGRAKFDLLSRHPFAIHACEGEAFGIAVAEMLLSGCVPFVPSSGGPAEIVGNDALCYSDPEDAAEKIHRALSEPDHAASLRNRLIGRGDRFMPEAFIESLQSLVASFSSCAVTTDAA
jgi:glycosyltransferase involved in cell wall biosynthesis